MAKLTQELRDMVAERVGRFNSDVLVGWEAGTQGKQRMEGSCLTAIHLITSLARAATNGIQVIAPAKRTVRRMRITGQWCSLAKTQRGR